MEDLSCDLDYLSDGVSQTELDEWLQTTDVFDQDVERLRPAPEDTAPPTQRPKRRDFDLDHKSSLEHGRSEKDMFGIDFPTAIRAAADRKARVKTHNSSVSSASSLCSKSKSQTITSPRPVIDPQPVIDLTASEPAIIDLTTTDNLPQPPRPSPCKRARRTFDSNINIDQLLTLMGKPSSSSVAAPGTEARAHNLLESARSYPPTRRTSVGSTESINNWQKQSYQYPQRTRSLPEVMPINNWQKKSHQDSRRISLPEPMPPSSSKDSSSPTSFFRDMDEHSSRIHRMMSSSSAVSHVGDDTNSISDSTITSNRSCCNEFHVAMEQTQQSRRMIMGALSGSTRSDGNNHVASGAHVAATALKMPECGMQCGLGEVAGLPYPRPNSSDATGTRNVATKAEAEVKRNLECIAREQMILEKRLAEMYRGIGR
jgi:hypothetical protein